MDIDLHLTEEEARVVVRALDEFRHLVSSPSGPIAASDTDYETATSVVERLARRAGVL